MLNWCLGARKFNSYPVFSRRQTSFKVDIVTGEFTIDVNWCIYLFVLFFFSTRKRKGQFPVSKKGT